MSAGKKKPCRLFPLIFIRVRQADYDEDALGVYHSSFALSVTSRQTSGCKSKHISLLPIELQVLQDASKMF